MPSSGLSMDDVLEFKGWGLGFRAYLDPKSMQNNSPKPMIISINAIIFPTFGVQVGMRVRVSGSGFAP